MTFVELDGVIFQTIIVFVDPEVRTSNSIYLMATSLLCFMGRKNVSNKSYKEECTKQFMFITYYPLHIFRKHYDFRDN
jgi:hypothetical protein